MQPGNQLVKQGTRQLGRQARKATQPGRAKGGCQGGLYEGDSHLLCPAWTDWQGPCRKRRRLYSVRPHQAAHLRREGSKERVSSEDHRCSPVEGGKGTKPITMGKREKKPAHHTMPRTFPFFSIQNHNLSSKWKLNWRIKKKVKDWWERITKHQESEVGKKSSGYDHVLLHCCCEPFWQWEA